MASGGIAKDVVVRAASPAVEPAWKPVVSLASCIVFAMMELPYPPPTSVTISMRSPAATTRVTSSRRATTARLTSTA